MIHEVKVQYNGTDKKGNERVFKPQYLVENALCFSDAETQVCEYLQGQGILEYDVTNIVRSKATEVANTRQSVDDKIWVAELIDVFTTDDGEEKEMKYKIFLFSKTFDSALAFITEYMKQGYNMSLVTLKLTKFAELI